MAEHLLAEVPNSPEGPPCWGPSITFRNQLPNEDIVYFIRRCASRLGRGSEGLEVIVEPRWSNRHRVHLRATDTARSLVECDKDAFLAVRNAFDRWAVDSRA